MLTVLTGDAIEQLRTLEDESVQCCVTSPPYWGLRDYGTAAWEGGDDGCDHLGLPMRTNNKPSNQFSTFHGGTSRATEPWKHGICGKCGATRIDSQLGLEKTPEEYVANMVEVFREVRRMLRKDGTLWLNLGDSYAGSGKGAWDNKDGGRKEVYIPDADSPQALLPKVPPGLKPKDLCGIPWMVAFALRADGWWLRSDIIWAKPNPMPESVTDRPTKSHEYLFLLTKSASYFYDAEAIKEQAEYRDDARPFGDAGGNRHGDEGSTYKPGREAFRAFTMTRNKRSVWTVATAPYPEAHFATYPPDLIKPCILAGTRVGDTVLDPFAGSGTTGMVALELGRKAVLIELNPKYCDLIRERCDVTPGLQLA